MRQSQWVIFFTAISENRFPGPRGPFTDISAMISSVHEASDERAVTRL